MARPVTWAISASGVPDPLAVEMAVSNKLGLDQLERCVEQGLDLVGHGREHCSAPDRSFESMRPAFS
jgi:hypothetical protein